MSNQTTPEDDETASFTGKVKNLVKKNKKVIIGGGTAALVVMTGVFVSLAKGQDAAEDVASEDVWDFEPVPDPAAGRTERQSPSLHTVREYQRRTKNGIITVPSYVRGGSTV